MADLRELFARELDEMRIDEEMAKNLVSRLRINETRRMVATAIRIAYVMGNHVSRSTLEGLLRELESIREDDSPSANRDRDFLRRCVAEELTRFCPRS